MMWIKINHIISTQEKDWHSSTKMILVFINIKQV